MNNYYIETDSIVRKHTKRYLSKLVERYSDLRNVDKLAQAFDKQMGIEKNMRETFIKVIDMNEKLNVYKTKL